MDWIEFSQQYVHGLQPGSEEHRAKIAEASAAWRAMKEGQEAGAGAMEHAENPSGDEIAGGVIAVAGGILLAGVAMWAVGNLVGRACRPVGFGGTSVG